MKPRNTVRVALTCFGLGAIVLAQPARAQIALAGAQINSLSNQVELLSPAGDVRPATLGECFCTGDLLTTQAAAQAALVFNDGSLARIGEQSQLYFWPQTRQLQLTQGTALLLVPPTQGQMFVYTPNAVTGVQNNGAIVRYVPTQGLTLVMALAHSPRGIVSISTQTEPPQEITLEAGQMAFIKETVVQVVEFELQEFYATSRLIEGLDPRMTMFGQGVATIATLRSALLAGLEQQSAFLSNSPVLDPAVISINDEAQGLFGEQAEAMDLSNPVAMSEELRRYDDAPPGVITPLPETSPTDSGQPAEPVQPQPIETVGSVETIPTGGVEPPIETTNTTVVGE